MKKLFTAIAIVLMTTTYALAGINAEIVGKYNLYNDEHVLSGPGAELNLGLDDSIWRAGIGLDTAATVWGGQGMLNYDIWSIKIGIEKEILFDGLTLNLSASYYHPVYHEHGSTFESTVYYFQDKVNMHNAPYEGTDIIHNWRRTYTVRDLVGGQIGLKYHHKFKWIETGLYISYTFAKLNQKIEAWSPKGDGAHWEFMDEFDIGGGSIGGFVKF